ncbi:hypothetical protein GSI_01324 [Ganoderma sinense ZZ0214-1]|uniref:HNH nuclease domain-containing protein n=1 Tax=Ganoderma sinense ZZ0214-1 TaxID=1077348 RepID=A0A2G8SV43_9APHY|nr:hypothetical protein GSI_01324 [Ganoderma sinense ZZ0214-1]
MAYSGPVILVHAQFPSVRPGVPGHSDPSTWVWVPCLEFPVERVNALQISSKPLKWIRYCIGAVTGTQGHLSRRQDVPEPVDYDQPLPPESVPESTALYYHVSAAEKELMFPTDPHLADPPKTNSVHSRAATTTSSIACLTFHQELRERDTYCVANGENELFCDAVHLVPHCKDDDYIKALTTRRCRGREEDIVPTIDDVRNGILLQADFHKMLRRTLAFMPLPNFALDINDVTVLPGAAGPPASSQSQSQMYIIHLFEPLEPFPIANTALRLPPSSSSPPPSPSSSSSLNANPNAHRWPPTALFDATYGAAVLHTFGTPHLHARASAIWDALYYDPHHGGSARSVAAAQVQRRRGRIRRAVARDRMAGTGHGEAGGPALRELAALVPYLGMGLGELAAYLEERARGDVAAEGEEKARVAERVRRWREGVVAAARAERGSDLSGLVGGPG